MFFKRLFIQGTEAEIEAQERRLELGQSILDAVAGQANSLKRNVGSGIVIGSTNTLPAFASSNTACRCQRNGSVVRNLR